MTLTHAISIFPILRSLASFVSTLDLFNLALTCSSNYLNILSKQSTFKVLRRNCLCDGHGLEERKAFTGPYSLRHYVYRWGPSRHIWEDEPIEVRLYNTKCNDNDTLPCRKCGINVCEECRYYSREPPRHIQRRPHLDSSFSSSNIMCLCEECDNSLENELQGQFLNELCDCDVYQRWICLKCVGEENRFTYDYYSKRTQWEGEEDTKYMTDHQFIRTFHCLCGKSVPQNMRPRCTWCRRRHLPEDQWLREWREVGSKPPELDPCYPFFAGDVFASRSDPLYPKLPYDGPIWATSLDA